MKMVLAQSKKSHIMKIMSNSVAMEMRKVNLSKMAFQSQVQTQAWRDSRVVNSRTCTSTNLQWLVKRAKIVTNWRSSHLQSNSRILDSARRTLRFRTPRQARVGIAGKWSPFKTSTTYSWTLLTSWAFKAVPTGLSHRPLTAMRQTIATGSKILSLYGTWRTGQRGMSTKVEICSSQTSSWWLIMLRPTTAQLTLSRKKLRRFSKWHRSSLRLGMAISWRLRPLSRWIIFEGRIGARRSAKNRWVPIIHYN